MTVTVTAESDTKDLYNGNVQTVTGYKAVGLLSGHELSGISASGSGKNVGEYPVTFTGTSVIMDGIVDEPRTTMLRLSRANGDHHGRPTGCDSYS